MYSNETYKKLPVSSGVEEVSSPTDESILHSED